MRTRSFLQDREALLTAWSRRKFRRHQTQGTTLEERFWGNVYCDPNTGCFLWYGPKNVNGYGLINYRDGAKSCQILVHRLAYEVLIGPVPVGMLVCHSCDTRECVNPEHLWIGSNSDNQQDGIAKGRIVGRRNQLGRMTLAELGLTR